jgi:putative flippase GtrA
VSAHPALNRELLRFALLGAGNTIVTSAAFYGLSAVLPAAVAFTIVYACGVALVTIATPRFVFSSTPTRASRASLGVGYVCIYLVGQATIRVLEHLDAPRAAIVLGTMAVTAPLGFVVARLFVGEANPDPPTEGLPLDSPGESGPTTDRLAPSVPRRT